MFPDVAKDLNVKVFNLMSRSNETRHIKWHETCRCKFRSDIIAFNNKQRWNNDKCCSECKELIDKGVCDKGYMLGILVIVNVNVINHVMLASIYLMKIVNVEKLWWINWLMNAMKILMK